MCVVRAWCVCVACAWGSALRVHVACCVLHVVCCVSVLCLRFECAFCVLRSVYMCLHIVCAYCVPMVFSSFFFSFLYVHFLELLHVTWRMRVACCMVAETRALRALTLRTQHTT